MNFGTNKTPAEIIKERAFGGTYFRDIYSGINGKWYRKYGVKCETSLRFWENKTWINPIDPYGWFQCYFRYFLSRKSADDERQINRWKGIVSRFKGKLVEMIKNANSRFHDYFISLKIKQVLLQWGYELIESDFF